MSSRSPSWSERILLLGAALAVVGLPSAAAAAPVPLPVVTTLTGAGGRSLLVLDLSAVPGAERPAVTVSQGGTPVVSSLSPIVSATMGVTLVVDNSADGAAELPAWLSAGARFILETPSRARATVLTAARPAAVATGPSQGPVDVVRALDAVKPDGERDTSAALALAADQFADIGPGHKVVVLYTSAPDAGGATVSDLSARYRSRGVLLVVVGPAASVGFWGAAASSTGGFFAPAGDPVVVPALDQVRTTLSSRRLVEIPTPEQRPATLDVVVDAEGVQLSGQAVIDAAPLLLGPDDDDDPAVPVAVWWVVAALGGAALAAIPLVRRRSAVAGASAAGNSTAPKGPGSSALGGASAAGSSTARGRAVLPHDPAEDIARGRAAVPPPEPDPGSAEPD